MAGRLSELGTADHRTVRGRCGVRIFFCSVEGVLMALVRRDI
jgi:hypothetical protein